MRRELRNQVILGVGNPKALHCNKTVVSTSRVTRDGGKPTNDGFTVNNNNIHTRILFNWTIILSYSRWSNREAGKVGLRIQRMRSIWSLSVISSSTKIWLYNGIVLSVATYACDTWKITAEVTQKLNVFHQRCVRIWIMSPTRKS